jgi:Erythromycin biosynthesis protein CIII-like, N-terminal domain
LVDLGAFPPMPPPGSEFPGWVVPTLADIAAGRMVPDLLAIAREWEPDLIVREGMELGGCIAAERLGIPHASVAGTPTRRWTRPTSTTSRATA